MPQSLTAIAAAAHAQFPKSTVEVAMDFFTKAGLVAFCGTSNDRLVKYGRRIESLVLQAEDYESPAVVEASLARLLRDATILLDGPGHVPKVPFGATGLQMPIATLGTMRFQQEWGPRIANMNMVGADVQDNLVRILKTAILDYGMNHIETARAYGSSEMQLGVALKQLMTTGVIQRSDFILQSKVNARADPAEFRKDLETTFQMLQVDYLDLFAVHGMNLEEQWEWTMGGGVDGDNCMKVVKEYVAAGKIRHVGFSTHAPTDMILKAVESGAFSYVNLHYHFIGSYTASGYGATTRGGNYDAIKLLHEKNMGIFIISPFDKGGAVYAPSRKLAKLCAPDAEPITHAAWWLWNHHRLAKGDGIRIHTFTVGAARPSDLDEPALAAYYQRTEANAVLAKVESVSARMQNAFDTALGTEWAESWWKGLPKAMQSQFQIEHGPIVWLYNCLQAFGMHQHALQRYKAYEGNAKTWDYSKSAAENFAKRGCIGWGYVPGLPLDPAQDYAVDLKDVPADNLEKVKAAEAFVYEWLATSKVPEGEESEEVKAAKQAKLELPADWQPAYDLRTWPDYPDQPKRT